MPVDTSMYSTLQTPNPMQTLGQVAGVAQQVNQATQSGIDTKETQALQPILRDVNAYSDHLGNIDFNKLVPMVMSAAPKNGASIISNMSAAQQQKTAAQNAIGTQSSDALQRASAAIFSMDPDKLTPELIDQTSSAINKNFTSPAAQQANTQMFEHAKALVANTKPGDPLRATGLQHLANMYQPIQAQQAINTPTPVQMGNGQQTWMQNIKPGVMGSPQNGVIDNTAVQQQLPPQTPIMQGNTPGYLGPQAGGVAPNGQQQAAGFVQSGTPIGAAENVKDNVSEMNRHFGTLQDQAQGTQMVQALKGNIQQLASKAVTGTENDRRSYVNGLLSLFGVPGTGDTKNDTDLLEKNLAQLNLSTPASSDAARTLISAARPGTHMNPEAIKEAAGQLSGQVNANMAVRNYLSQYKMSNNGQGDSQAYQQARQHVEKVADPRIWQYMDLQPGSAEATKFIKKLPAADRDPKTGLLHKIKQLESMKVFDEPK